jgi:hypothetical protein
VVGGPFTLHRETSPYAASTHPFRFTLEPVTTASLAKYVVAESHTVTSDELTPSGVTGPLTDNARPPGSDGG